MKFFKIVSLTIILVLFQTCIFSVTKEEQALVADAQQGKIQAVKNAINKKVNINATDAAGNTALIAATRAGKNDIVKYLLSQPGIDINKKFTNGRSALIVALANKQSEAALLLLDNPKVDVNIQDNDGNTALILAVKEGNPVITNKIIAKPNVNLNLKNKAGQTAMAVAANENIKNILKAKSQPVQPTKPVVKAPQPTGQKSFEEKLEEKLKEEKLKELLGRTKVVSSGPVSIEFYSAGERIRMIFNLNNKEYNFEDGIKEILKLDNNKINEIAKNFDEVMEKATTPDSNYDYFAGHYLNLMSNIFDQQNENNKNKLRILIKPAMAKLGEVWKYMISPKFETKEEKVKREQEQAQAFNPFG